jgi:DNA-binding transcriptional regulator PaaX
MVTNGRWDVGDPDVDAFVDANILSFAAWDLVIYLNRNPETCEPLSKLAAILARQESDMLPAVHRLTETGVLSAERSTGEAVSYRLTDDLDVRRIMARFITMAGRREHRLEFVRRVLAHITGG